MSRVHSVRHSQYRYDWKDHSNGNDAARVHIVFAHDAGLCALIDANNKTGDAHTNSAEAEDDKEKQQFR